MPATVISCCARLSVVSALPAAGLNRLKKSVSGLLDVLSRSADDNGARTLLVRSGRWHLWRRQLRWSRSHRWRLWRRQLLLVPFAPVAPVAPSAPLVPSPRAVRAVRARGSRRAGRTGRALRAGGARCAVCSVGPVRSGSRACGGACRAVGSIGPVRAVRAVPLRTGGTCGAVSSVSSVGPVRTRWHLWRRRLRWSRSHPWRQSRRQVPFVPFAPFAPAAPVASGGAHRRLCRRRSSQPHRCRWCPVGARCTRGASGASGAVGDHARGEVYRLDGTVGNLRGTDCVGGDLDRCYSIVGNDGSGYLLTADVGGPDRPRRGSPRR